MGRKKNIKPQDVSPEEMDFIDKKLYGSSYVTNEFQPFVSYDYQVKLKCMNKAQKDFLKLLKDETKVIVTALGSAGTGKSYISLAYALSELKSRRFHKVIQLVPTTPAGSKYLDLGLLPGDLNAKMMPFIQQDIETMTKILDKSENCQSSKIIDGLIRNGVIEHRALSYIRGASWDNTLICLNEIENFNVSEILLMLTRLGDNSKIIMTGDVIQCDRPDIKNKSYRDSGIEYVVERLQGMEEFGLVRFTKDDIVRNPLITKILERLYPE
jgi:phosphate starvation-inducible PhoH-like protein